MPSDTALIVVADIVAIGLLVLVNALLGKWIKGLRSTLKDQKALLDASR
jgi:hypothetical protein